MAAVDTTLDLVWFRSSITGTGSYVSSGAKAGFRDISAYSVGAKVSYAARDGTRWETGYGTVTTSGGSPALTRDSIEASSNSNNPVSWVAGTIEVYTTPLANDIMLRNKQNTLQAHLDFDGFRAIMSPNGTHYFVASDSATSFIAGTTFQARLTPGSTGDFTLEFTDAGAGAGPRLVFDRISSTPAANDDLGQTRYNGRDSGGNTTTYAAIGATIDDPTNGSEDGGWYGFTIKNGVSENFIRAYDTLVAIGYAGSGRHLTVGKNTAQGGTTAGWECRSTGQTYTIVDNITASVVDIINHSGTNTCISFRTGGTQRGSISTNGTTVAYNTTSDVRLKDNIEDLDGYDDILEGLRPVAFRWKANQRADIGLIAQEVAKVLPEAVNENPDGFLELAYGSGAMIAVLVAGLKDARDRIAELEARV